MTDGRVVFLRARLDEDAEVARAARREIGEHWDMGEGDYGYVMSDGNTVVYYEGVGSDNAMGVAAATHAAQWDPARAYDEIEAKRRTIARCEAALGMDDGRGAAMLAETVLGDLTAPYRMHPDYKPEWAPDA